MKRIRDETRIRNKLFKNKCKLIKNKKGSLEHPVFPGGHPSKY
jgi:hypothetical protein